MHVVFNDYGVKVSTCMAGSNEISVSYWLKNGKVTFKHGLDDNRKKTDRKSEVCRGSTQSNLLGQ